MFFSVSWHGPNEMAVCLDNRAQLESWRGMFSWVENASNRRARQTAWSWQLTWQEWINSHLCRIKKKAKETGNNGAFTYPLSNKLTAVCRMNVWQKQCHFFTLRWLISAVTLLLWLWTQTSFLCLWWNLISRRLTLGLVLAHPSHVATGFPRCSLRGTDTPTDVHINMHHHTVSVAV